MLEHILRTLRRILSTDKALSDGLIRLARAHDELRDELLERMEEMGQAYRDAMASVVAEVESERSLFIAAVKLFQANANQVQAAADSMEDGKPADDLKALAAQMRENAGPLASAMLANTPAEVPPMAPSPAVPEGSGDGVSARLPSDPSPTLGTAAAAASEGQQRVDPSDPTLTQVYRNGAWVANDGSQDGPKEGDTRTNSTTGDREVYRGGSWTAA